MMLIYLQRVECPKCELFRNGLDVQWDGVNDRVERKDELHPHGGLEKIITLCRGLWIPYVEIDVDYDKDKSIYPVMIDGEYDERKIMRNPFVWWVMSFANKQDKPIDLPSFIVKSRLGKNRLVNVEIVTEGEEYLITQGSAARQVFRSMAYTAIEERLKAQGESYGFKKVKYLFNQQYPDELGENDVNLHDWREAFVRSQKLKVYSSGG